MKMYNTFFRIVLILIHIQLVISQYTFNNVKLEAYTSRTSNGNTIFLTKELRIPKSLDRYLALLIENQQIPRLYAGSFLNLPHLAYLEIIANNITDVEPGSFQKLPNLYLLDLSKNKLKNLQKGVFNDLPISGLILSRNEIHEIDVEAFDDLTNLRYLDVSGNKLKHIKGDWFQNTPKLVEVRLDYNQISELPQRAFRNLRTQPREHYYSAKYPTINLSNNHLTKIHPDAFGGIEEIWQLRLDRNGIAAVKSDMFESVYKVHHLNVSYNQIKCFSSGLLQKLRRTVTLDITGNQFSKDCVGRIVEWSKQNDVDVAL